MNAGLVVLLYVLLLLLGIRQKTKLSQSIGNYSMIVHCDKWTGAVIRKLTFIAAVF